MSTAAIIALITAIANGIPKLIEKIREGRKLKDIRLGDFVSHDALEKVEKADAIADDYVKNG